MRYSKQISTGLLIESQSGGNPDNPLHLSTMVDNAVNGGLLESDVEVGYCTDEEHDVMLKAKQPVPTYQELRVQAYPPIGDQLDALWKGGQPEADMKLIIDGVKATYPKVI